MLPYQVCFLRSDAFKSQTLIACMYQWHGIILDLQALDPRILDNVPVAPQFVRQPGTVPRADPRAGTGASLLSPRDKMDVSVNLWPAGSWHEACATLSCLFSRGNYWNRSWSGVQTFNSEHISEAVNVASGLNPRSYLLLFDIIRWGLFHCCF